jgi:hypothetical protein
MTRKSKREIERALENLDAGDGAITEGESFAEQHYSEPVTSFVHRTIREVLRLAYDPEIANADDRARGLLATVREVYEIGEDRDDAVLATLDERAGSAKRAHWHPTDAFATAVAVGPRLLNESTRARFDSALEAGNDDIAAQLVVQAVYEWLAKQDGGRLEVTT